MNKFKLTYHEPEIESDQIRRYQNFDQLLGSFESTKSRRSPSRYSKFLLGGFFIMTIVVISYLFLNESTPSEALEQTTPKSQTEQHISPLNSTGSGSEHSAEKDKVIAQQENKQQWPKANSSEDKKQEKALPEKKNPVNEAQKKVIQPDGNHPKEIASTSGNSDEELAHSFTEAIPKEGMKALYQYFNTALVYPEKEMELKKEGTVILTFFIDKEGLAENIEVVQPVSEGIDQEAVRLVEEMPEWKPAVVKGQAVSSRVTLPITFKITDSNAE